MTRKKKTPQPPSQDTAPTQPKLPENKFPVVVKNKMGRPSDYSEYTTRIICKRIVEGESLKRICRDDEMPDVTTVFDWLARRPDFAHLYALAMEQRTETHVEETLEIADDGTNDWVEKTRDDGSTYMAVDHEHIQRSKLRIDTRKWIASKLKPRKYGDRVIQEHTGVGGGPIQTQSANITISAADLDPDARDALRQVLLLAANKPKEGGG